MKEIIILLVVAVLLFISSGLGVAYMVYTPIKNCKTEAANSHKSAVSEFMDRKVLTV